MVLYNMCGYFVVGLMVGWIFVEMAKAFAIFIAGIERRIRG